MTRRSPKNTPDRLPPPTKSEAAFEKVLASFAAAAPALRQAQRDKKGGSPSVLRQAQDDKKGGAPSVLRQAQDDSGAVYAEPAEASKGTVTLSLSKGEGADAFVEELFARRDEFLDDDRFRTIGAASSFYTKIVGVSFEGRQDILAGLTEGAELQFKRQPDNPFDSNAVAVHFGALQLGFLKKEIAKHLAANLDANVRYHVEIGSLTGGGSKHLGVNIFVRRDSPAQTPGATVDRAHADGEAVKTALIGDRELRDSQRDVLQRVDDGKNTLAILGTGRGKSFCFQYPAALRALESGAKTLVIYPLRALANDQYDALARRFDGLGLRIFRANGSIGADDRNDLMTALRDGSWDIILATPEFLQFHREAFGGPSSPEFVVVDEAHHLYDSRHRAAYAKLGSTIASLGNAQILALTATAGDDAFAHIVKELAIAAWVIDPTVRENLEVVDARGTKDKESYLRNVFESGGKGIVYCNSRTGAVKVADALRKTFGNTVAFYHAGVPNAERQQVERYFREGEVRIVVATSAFGEGIDLPDVRDVVLYHLNFDFTEFNQQAGRAGRDGRPARIHLLFGEADRRINDYIIDREAPTLPLLREIYKGMRAISPGGSLRMTFVDIARTLELDKANERTISVAARIFEDAGLLVSGMDDDGRFLQFLPAPGKVDMSKNERFAEGEAERESFSRFCDLILSAGVTTLQNIINRPIYPQSTPLRA